MIPKKGDKSSDITAMGVPSLISSTLVPGKSKVDYYGEKNVREVSEAMMDDYFTCSGPIFSN